MAKVLLIDPPGASCGPSFGYKVYSSQVRTLAGIFWLIAKHAPLRGFLHIIQVLPKVWKKVRSGRIPLSEKDLAFVEEK